MRVTAGNAGPFTFTGSNSFIIGRDSVAVVDPGPEEPKHRGALTEVVGGRKVEAILLPTPTRITRREQARCRPRPARRSGLPGRTG